jgi:hypothetical protein
LKKLQRNKAAGLDGMKIEFIFNVRELLHMPLLTAFNNLLMEGFPKVLSIGVVHTFFKGGDAFKFDNYRGLTVGLILAKLFTMILDKRLASGLNNMGCVPRVKLSFAKIATLLTKFSYYGC